MYTGPLRLKHSYNAGDLVATLPGIKHFYEETGRKSIVMQVLDFPAFYYEGAEHPIKNSEGQQVTMNAKMWEMLVPLLLSQEYIEDAIIWEGQEHDISFDDTRDRRMIPLPYGDIHFWPFFVIPNLQCDLSRDWLTFDVGNLISGIEDKILINRTVRYQNPYIKYYFLKKYENNVLFIGTMPEYIEFKSVFNIDIQYLPVPDFEILALCIKGCKFFIGNQSFCWHLADAMKIPRILEVCSQFPNTVPTGANGYAFLYQEALEYYVETLFNK